MPMLMAMPDMWVGSPITWQGWQDARRAHSSEHTAQSTRKCSDRGKAQGTHERRQGQRHACQCPWLCLTCGWGALSHGRDGKMHVGHKWQPQGAWGEAWREVGRPRPRAERVLCEQHSCQMLEEWQRGRAEFAAAWRCEARAKSEKQGACA